jgi:hypothetical protein
MVELYKENCASLWDPEKVDCRIAMKTLVDVVKQHEFKASLYFKGEDGMLIESDPERIHKVSPKSDRLM